MSFAYCDFTLQQDAQVDQPAQKGQLSVAADK
jgi:hypothetical protein